MTSFFVASCTAPQPAPDPLIAQQKILHRLTDEILTSLAARDYHRLERLLGPDQNLPSGRQVAAMLLGRNAASLVLQRWDAGKIQVVFTDDLLGVTAKVHVTYRRAPNRPPRTSVFTFRFYRSSQQDNWRLDLR